MVFTRKFEELNETSERSTGKNSYYSPEHSDDTLEEYGEQPTTSLLKNHFSLPPDNNGQHSASLSIKQRENRFGQHLQQGTGLIKIIEDEFLKKKPAFEEYLRNGYNITELDRDALSQAEVILCSKFSDVNSPASQAIIMKISGYLRKITALTFPSKTSPEIQKAINQANDMTGNILVALEAFDTARIANGKVWTEQVAEKVSNQLNYLAEEAIKRLNAHTPLAVSNEDYTKTKNELMGLLFSKSNELMAENAKFEKLTNSLMAEERVMRSRLSDWLEMTADQIVNGARDAKEYAMQTLYMRHLPPVAGPAGLVTYSADIRDYYRHITAIDGTPAPENTLTGTLRPEVRDEPASLKIARALLPVSEALGEVVMILRQQSVDLRPAPEEIPEFYNDMWDEAAAFLREIPKKLRRQQQGLYYIASGAGTAFKKAGGKARAVLSQEPAIKSDSVKHAVKQTGLLLLDQLHQAERLLKLLPTVAWELQEAVEQHQRVTALTVHSINRPVLNSVLDEHLAQEAARWQRKIELSEAKLKTLLAPLTLFAQEKWVDDYYDELSAVLEQKAGDEGDRHKIIQFDNLITTSNNKFSAIAHDIEGSVLQLARHGHAGGNDLIIKVKHWLQKIQLLNGRIGEIVLRVTGENLDFYSRGGMLARGVAEWAEDLKQDYLLETETENQEEAIALFEQSLMRMMEDNAHVFSKASDPGAKQFLQRLKLELKHAARKTTTYPPTPEEILAGSRSLSDNIKHWAQKKVISGAISAAIRQGFKVISGPASMPGRIILRGARTGLAIYRGNNAINRGIKFGQGPATRIKTQFIEDQLSTAAFKLTMSLSPLAGWGVSAAITVERLLAENKYSKKFVTRTLTDLPEELLWQSGYSGMNSVFQTVFKHAVAQSDIQQAVELNLSPAEADKIISDDIHLSRDSELIQTVIPGADDHINETDEDKRHRVKKRAVAQTRAPSIDNIIKYNFKYSNLSDDAKKTTYLNAINFMLFRIEINESYPAEIQDKAHLARIGAPLLNLIYINDVPLSDVLFLPTSDDGNSGFVFDLTSTEPVYWISNPTELREHVKTKIPEYGWNNGYLLRIIGKETKVVPGTAQFFDMIKKGDISSFNTRNDAPMTTVEIANKLFLNSRHPLHINEPDSKKILTEHGISGSFIPAPDESITPMQYKLEISWEKLSTAQYLRSIAQPFSQLSGQIQLISSDSKGETLQQTTESVNRAKYIGSWVDVTVGAVTSYTPTGLAINTAQSVADISADVAEKKNVDPLAVAGVILGSIPGEKVAGKIGKFSSIAGKSTKYALMIGNKSIDLAIMGRSIEGAIETDEPLAIYQALITSGMSVHNSYNMTKSMCSQLKIKKSPEESASIDQLIAVENTAPETVITSMMPVRKFKIGQKTLLGKIINNEIQISRDNGANWQPGSKLHLLIYRLQNAGGVRKLPNPEDLKSTPPDTLPVSLSKNQRLNPDSETNEAAGPSTFNSNGVYNTVKDRFYEQNPEHTVFANPAKKEPYQTDYYDAEESSLNDLSKSVLTTAEIEEARKTLLEDIYSTPNAKAQMDKITEYPAGQCDTAAKKILQLLTGKGYKTKIIGVLNYKDLKDNAPMDHYVVLATKNGKTLVIDSTFNQYLAVARREWVITSIDEWQKKLINSDHLKNKIVIIKEYSGIQKAYNEVNLPERNTWIESKYVRDPQFKTLQVPDFMIRGLQSAFKTDIDYINSKNGIKNILNADNKIKKLDKRLKNLKQKEKEYDLKDKNVPNKIMDKIKNTSRKIENLQKLKKLPERVENLLIFFQKNPTLREAGTGINSLAFNELSSSKLLERIPHYRELLAQEKIPSRSVNLSSDQEQMVYAGPSTSHDLSFDKQTNHHININKINRILLSKNFNGNKVKSYDHAKEKFVNNEEFSLIRAETPTDKVKNIASKEQTLASISEMINKAKKLIENAKNYSGSDKKAVLENLYLTLDCLNPLKSIIESKDLFNDSGLYILTKKGAKISDIQNHYGIVVYEYHYSDSRLELSFLTAHPNVIVNKYPAFRNYLVRNNLISKSELPRYNIKNIARYLGFKSAVSEIQFYESIPHSKVKTFSFHGANPITQKLGYKLETMSNLFSSKKRHGEITDSEDIGASSSHHNEEDLFSDQIAYLRTIVRDSFTPAQVIGTLSDEKAQMEIEKIMANQKSIIISDNIVESTKSNDNEVKEFSERIITSVDKAVEKSANVKKLFDLAEYNPELKKQLKFALAESAGLGDEVPVDIDKVDASAVSDMVYNRFRDNVNKTFDYLKNQQSEKYDSFVIFRHLQPDASAPGAYALPYDRRKRILLAIDQGAANLVDTVVHESTHNAAYTLDHTYIGNIRSEVGEFPSTFNYSERDVRHFSDNDRLINLSTNYALGLPENHIPTEQQKTQGLILLTTSKLVKADTLLNSAEYNAYMIHVLSGAQMNEAGTDFVIPDSRTKRMVSAGDDKLDEIIMLAALQASGNYATASALNISTDKSAEVEEEIKTKSANKITHNSAPLKNWTDYGSPGDIYYENGNYWKLKTEGRPAFQNWNYPPESKSNEHWDYIPRQNDIYYENAVNTQPVVESGANIHSADKPRLTFNNPGNWEHYGLPDDIYYNNGVYWQLRTEGRPSLHLWKYPPVGMSNQHWTYMASHTGTQTDPKTQTEYGFPGNIYLGKNKYWKLKSEGRPSDNSWSYPQNEESDDHWTYLASNPGTLSEPKNDEEYGFPGDYYKLNGSIWKLKIEGRPSEHAVNPDWLYPTEGESNQFWEFIMSHKGTRDDPKTWDEYGSKGDIYFENDTYWQLKTSGKPSEEHWKYLHEGESNHHWLYIGKHSGTQDDPKTWMEYGFPGDIYFVNEKYWELKSQGRPSDQKWSYPDGTESDSTWRYIGKHSGTKDEPKTWMEYGFPGDIYFVNKKYWELKSQGRPSDKKWFCPDGTESDTWRYIGIHSGTQNDPKIWTEYGYPGDFYKEHGNLWQFKSIGRPSQLRLYYSVEGESDPHWTHIRKITGTSALPKNLTEYGFPGDIYYIDGNYYELKTRGGYTKKTVQVPNGRTDDHWIFLGDSYSYLHRKDRYRI